MELRKRSTGIPVYLGESLPETYLGLFQTSLMERFCENNYWLKAVNYFRKDTQSKMLERVVNTPLDIKMTYLSLNFYLYTGTFHFKNNILPCFIFKTSLFSQQKHCITTLSLIAKTYSYL